MPDDATKQPAAAAEDGAPRLHRLMVLLDVYHDPHGVAEAVLQHILKTIATQMPAQLGAVTAMMIADSPLSEAKDAPRMTAHCRARFRSRSTTPERFAHAVEQTDAMVKNAEAMQGVREARAAGRLN